MNPRRGVPRAHDAKYSTARLTEQPPPGMILGMATIQVKCSKCQAVSPVPLRRWEQALQKGATLTCPVCGRGKVVKVG